MRFTKMHGAGNDYVFISAFEEAIDDAGAIARRVADRHKGIGSDGLIVIGPSDRADVRMTMYNADGSRGRMCGNGLRCVARYAVDHHLVSGAGWGDTADRPAALAGLWRFLERTSPYASQSVPVTVETDSGVLGGAVLRAGPETARVCVDLGYPDLRPDAIPVRLPGERVVEHPLEIGSRTCPVTCVSMGSPHVVLFTGDLDTLDITAVGPMLETHDIFPDRINVHVARVASRHHVNVRHWERGSGVTQACGTGAAAVCVAGTLTGRTDPEVEVTMPGGSLHVCWERQDRVYQTGPAVVAFEGQCRA